MDIGVAAFMFLSMYALVAYVEEKNDGGSSLSPVSAVDWRWPQKSPVFFFSLGPPLRSSSHGIRNKSRV